MENGKLSWKTQEKTVSSVFLTLMHSFSLFFYTQILWNPVNRKVEREVGDYEDRYRGRELPGFINYKTFEVMVKEQIRQLEDPAIMKLKDIGGNSDWK